MLQVQEKALRALLQPAGFVWELTIPRGPDGRGKGFAFAAFTKKSDAEKAIALANGKVVAGRPVAVDWAVAKAQYVVTQVGAALFTASLHDLVSLWIFYPSKACKFS